MFFKPNHVVPLFIVKVETIRSSKSSSSIRQIKFSFLKVAAAGASSVPLSTPRSKDNENTSASHHNVNQLKERFQMLSSHFLCKIYLARSINSVTNGCLNFPGCVTLSALMGLFVFPVSYQFHDGG